MIIFAMILSPKTKWVADLIKRWEALHAGLKKLEKEHPEKIDNLDSHRGQLSALYFCINELKFAMLERKL